MSGKILKLPEDLTNKIAAGEVVERPASIVKELLENALDAGATDIVIELENGGCGAIKIADNGDGMDDDDALRAFERYATSKIYQFDDIYQVTSFGFRGEALPSIASIARVEMLTRKRDALSGMKVLVENGLLIESAQTGCPPGTAIRVDRIFDAVPVRKKFLKSETTEQGSCMDVITRTALAHPEVKIKVMARGRMLLNIPATKDASERAALILGADFTDHCLPVSGTHQDIAVSGLVSRPDFTRSSSKQLFIYVNKRFIRDYLISHAVMTVYGRLIVARRYPSAVLFLEMPTNDVDVNVHPTKMEVRFRNPRGIYDAIYKILTAGLTETGPVIGRPSAEISPFQRSKGGSFAYPTRLEEALKRYTVSSGGNKLFFSSRDLGRAGKTINVTPPPPAQLDFPELQPEKSASAPDRLRFAELEYIGQAGDLYLLFQSPEGLVILDQHAAHERVLFEKLKQDAADNPQSPPMQRLLIPEVLNLTARDYAFVMQERQVFAQAGIEIDPFGSHEVAVKTLPARLSHIPPKSLLLDMLEEFSETERVANPTEKQDRIFALLACKGAVKAKQRLSPEEVAALCRAMDEAPYSATCPHGRPVYIAFSFTDFEKMFKRR